MENFYKRLPKRDIKEVKGNIIEIERCILSQRKDATYIRYKVGIVDKNLNLRNVGFALLLFGETFSNDNYSLLRSKGHKHIPNVYFNLATLDIQEEYRSKSVGSHLLNTIIEDISQYNTKNRTNYPILFEKLNNKKNDSFYDRFFAKLNEIRKDYEDEGAICMQIETLPQEKFKGHNVCIFKHLAKKEDIDCERY